MNIFWKSKMRQQQVSILTQHEDDCIDAFYISFKKLAKSCNYKDLEDRMVRDRIVIGVHDKRLQHKLLEIKDFTLDTAINMARCSEVSKIYVKTMEDQHVVIDAIQKGAQSSSTGIDKYKFNKNKGTYLCKKNATKHMGLESVQPLD